MYIYMSIYIYEYMSVYIYLCVYIYIYSVPAYMRIYLFQLD
jgi:hypothetical protein